jgi:predicted lipoprotein with Yx(FWY)xxD motif
VRSKLVTSIVALAILLGACGDDGDDETSTTEAPSGDSSETTEAAPGAAAGNAIAQAGETELGEVLTNSEGLTLYGLTDDTDGQSTCDGDCANAWPPLLVDSAELPEGLDPAVFSVTERDDGTFQLVAGSWPLYTFSGDSAPGDTNGQGSGDVWFAASPSGELIQDGAGAGDSGDSGDTESTETTESDDGGTGYDTDYGY